MSTEIPAKIQDHIDALVADGCVVLYLPDIDMPGLPDVVATKNGANYVFRLVPNPEATTVVTGGFSLTAEELQWDTWFTADGKGAVYRYISTQDAISLLNATPVPT